MDDLSEKLNRLLSNPEELNAALQNARQLLGVSAENTENTEKPEISKPDALPGLENLSEAENIFKIISALKQTDTSKDDALLIALKPHLSFEKAQKVDTALKILRLIKIAPLLINGLEGIF